MIEGYCWPQSGQAGDVVELFVSSLRQSTAEVQIVRIGASETVVETQTITGVVDQGVPDDVAVNGCGWSPNLNIEIDPAWPTGFYLVRLSTDDGSISEAFFVVRAAPNRASPGSTLLVLSTSTWAAYNDWGGPSFYTGGHRSSQLRPLPRGFLDKPDPERYRIARFAELPKDERRAHFDQYSYWSAAAGWANWERLFVWWAETEGVELDYATSLDLANDPGLLEPYGAYVSVGHDEYWSASMRDHVESFVDNGGGAAFFSGNTAFWQIRYEQDDTQVVGYKLDFADDPVMGTDQQHTVSTMWSDPLCERPESEMTGVTFTRGGYAHVNSAPKGSGGYSIWRPEHWAFDGLDLYPGDLVGADPVVVGYECDGCELVMENGLPTAAGTAGTPQNFEVLGTAPAHLWATEEGAAGLPDTYVGELNWVAERLGGGDSEESRARFANGHAVMGAFRRGKGEVFTTGCTDWAYGLGDEACARITRNVLEHLVNGNRA